MDLSGKTALVTGAGRRIGRATALALGRNGANVVVHYRRSEAEARAVVAELAGIGVRSIAVRADLGDTSTIDQLFRDSLRLSGTLDILVNSASIFGESRLDDVAAAAFKENLQINATAPFLLMRELHRHLEQQRRNGSVVNFLDTRVTDFDRTHVAYAVSKRVLHTLTQMAAVEYAPLMRVNAVAPGLILPPEGKDRSYLERLKSTNPLNAYGDLEQLTDAVLFLLGSEFVTGQTIWVDGGRHLRGDFYGY